MFFKSPLQKFFDRFVKHELRDFGIYAVTDGTFKGDFYVVFHQGNQETTFISLPDFKTVKLDKKTIETGLKTGILDLVKVLREPIYAQIVKEYLGRKSDETNSRQQQSITPNILG